MTYGVMGLGSVTAAQAPRVGHAAAQDPILGSASLMAASLLRQVSGLPESKRIDAARRKLNAIHPGLGNTAVSKAKELRRKGRPFNQALFDGMRLAIANRVAEYTTSRMGVSGLGAVKTENLQAGFCAMIGAGTAGAGMAAAFKNPTATEGILSSGQAGGQIAGCGAGTLSQQAAATQAQLDAAAAAAAASSSSGGGTSPWLWAGLGLVAIAGIGLVVVKAKS